MKSIVRALMILPLAMGLAACMDATNPRLPPGDEEPDTSKPGAGYFGHPETPVTGG